MRYLFCLLTSVSMVGTALGASHDLSFKEGQVGPVANHYKKGSPVVKDYAQMSAPESAYFASESGTIYVSNIVGAGDKKDGNGYIAKLSKANASRGFQPWVKGLNAPKGMRLYKGTLWVSDIDEIVAIDVFHGTIIKKISVPGAKFLNDVAVDRKGTVYVSDTIASRIYRVRDGKVDTFLSGAEWQSPNGLLVQGDQLLVAAWGLASADWSTKVPGKLYRVDLKTKKRVDITKRPLGNLDGLEIDSKGNYIVSDWVAGKVYRIAPTGVATELLKGMKGAADLALNNKEGTVIIPRMQEDRVSIVKL